MIYFTADTHFGSERTIKYNFRPFASVKEMDNAIIFNWNTVVKPKDTVYHLGDFGDYENIKFLNGKVNLIIGNYEEKYINERFAGDAQKFIEYLKNLGFNNVIFGGLKLILPNENLIAYLTHKPIDCKLDMFNIFGHIHNLCMIKSFGLNVGADVHNYFPIPQERVVYYKKCIETVYDENVFCTGKELEK
ncbi:MAG: hypothetical protein M0R51_04490 [Clostridia bacterium]|jgi:calcineurin-like phosphoesterase family protein|nr:hypothetical protein [Clostridia bacterium]